MSYVRTGHIPAVGPKSTGVCEVHPLLPFSVDHWEAQDRRPGFLSHAHTDHTEGILKWATQSGKKSLFCSEDTWRLLGVRHPELSKVHAHGCLAVKFLEVGESYFAEHHGQSFEVTPLDANHCSGSLMYLFQGTSFGTVLHTGDCRLTGGSHGPIAALKGVLDRRGIRQIDVMYLDCTFGAFPKAFPSRKAAIAQVRDIIRKHLRGPNSTSTVYLSCEGLGNEDVLQAVYRQTGEPIYVPSRASEGLAWHGSDSTRLRHEELRLLVDPRMITDDPTTRFHLCGGRKLVQEMRKRRVHDAGSIAIRPSVQADQIGYMENMQTGNGGGSFGALRGGSNVTGSSGPPNVEPASTEPDSLDYGVYKVVCSGHSSLPELYEALQEIRPRLVVPHSANAAGMHPCLLPQKHVWPSGPGGTTTSTTLAAAEEGTERAGKNPLDMPEAAVLRLSEKAAELRQQPIAAPPPPLPPTGLLSTQGNRQQTEGPRAATAPVHKEELIGGGGRHWRSEGGSFCSSQNNAMNAILLGRGQRAVAPKRSRSPGREGVIGSRKGVASSGGVAEGMCGIGRDWAASAEQEQQERRNFPSLSKEQKQEALLPRGLGPSAPWTAKEEERRQKRESPPFKVEQQQRRQEALLPWHCLSGDTSGAQAQHRERKQESPVNVEEPRQEPLRLSVPGASAQGTAALEQERQGDLNSAATAEKPVWLKPPGQGSAVAESKPLPREPLGKPDPAAEGAAVAESEHPLREPLGKPDRAAQGAAVAESEPPLREPLGRFLPGVGGRLLFLGPVQ